MRGLRGGMARRAKPDCAAESIPSASAGKQLPPAHVDRIRCGETEVVPRPGIAMNALHGLLAATLLLAAGAAQPAGPAAAGLGQAPREHMGSPKPARGTPVPSFLYEGSGDYDPFTRRWIHHAGHDGIPQGFHTFTFDLDSGRWEQKFPPTSPPGVCCVDGGNCFDLAEPAVRPLPRRYARARLPVEPRREAEGLGRVALRPGRRTTWTNMRPTPYKEPEKGPPQGVGGLNAGAVYDPNHEVVLAFGGQGDDGGKNTLFAYDAYANVAPPPEGRRTRRRPATAWAWPTTRSTTSS